MAADLHIHVMTKEMNEEHLSDFFSNTLGSKYFNINKQSDCGSEGWRLIANSPNVHVGEVSWLKAALLDNPDEFIPDPISKVNEIIGEDLPVIDDELINKIQEALKLKNNTRYVVSSADEIVAFLNKWKGYKAFTVSW